MGAVSVLLVLLCLTIIVALMGIGCGLRRTGVPAWATRDSASST